MENTMKMYVTADEAAQILGVSRGYPLLDKCRIDTRARAR